MNADLPPPPPEAAEVRDAPPQEARSMFARVGAGIGRGALFLGSDHAREASRTPLAIDVGTVFRHHLGASVGLIAETGRSEHGISMTRVVLGGSFEPHFGPFFVGVGPHASWFGATRRTNGDVLWRLGLGLHAVVGVDVHVAPHVGVFVATRVDGDALLKLGETTAPWASVTGVVGMSFY